MNIYIYNVLMYMDILIVFRIFMGIDSMLNSWLMVLLYCLCKILLDFILCDRSYVYVRVVELN